MSDALPIESLDRHEVSELAESLGLVPVGTTLPADVDAWMTILRTQVAAVIGRWLQHDRARLGQALYRIDVDEALVEEVVKTSPIDEVAERVAMLVIDRVLRRIANRRRLEQMLREP